MEEIEALGNDHIGTSSDTPLREDAFELSDIEKIAMIKKDVTKTNPKIGAEREVRIKLGENFGEES